MVQIGCGACFHSRLAHQPQLLHFVPNPFATCLVALFSSRILMRRAPLALKSRLTFCPKTSALAFLDPFFGQAWYPLRDTSKGSQTLPTVTRFLRLVFIAAYLSPCRLQSTRPFFLGTPPRSSIPCFRFKDPLVRHVRFHAPATGKTLFSALAQFTDPRVDGCHGAARFLGAAFGVILPAFICSTYASFVSLS